MTGLPKVKINVATDNLGQSVATSDGVAGLILSGTAVNNGIQIDQPIQIFSLADAIEKGITEDGENSFAFRHVKDFYKTAGDGSELWVSIVTEDTLFDSVLDSQGQAEKMIVLADGRIRLLAVSLEHGLSDEYSFVEAIGAINVAKALTEKFAKEYMDVSILIDGLGFPSEVVFGNTNIPNLTEKDCHFISVFIGSDRVSNNSSIGLLLGRLAKDPVHRNPGRVRSGSLPISNAYLSNNEPSDEEIVSDKWDLIHNQGFIFLRNFIGKAGYYFTDAPTCTSPASDLNSIPRVRTIYKARRIAYSVFVEEILEEIPLEADGKIAPAFIKSWQAKVEGAITSQMTNNGEISGVRCIIDPAQDVLASNEIKIQLKVQPVGYAKYISVDLGFATSLTE